MCPEGSVSQQACGAGYYQPNPIQPNCYECPAGYACTDSTGSTVDRDLTGFECPEGYYCEARTGAVDDSIKCPAGTYNDHVGAQSN